jgi:hypothetical protein
MGEIGHEVRTTAVIAFSWGTWLPRGEDGRNGSTASRLSPVRVDGGAGGRRAPLLFDTPAAGEPIKLGDGLVSLKEPRPNVLCEFGYTHDRIL